MAGESGEEKDGLR